MAHRLRLDIGGTAILWRPLPGKNKIGPARRRNRYLVEEGGFEPPKRNATDLQSAPFGHSGTPPDLVVKAAAGGPQIEAQLSGFDLERRRSEGNELSCLHGSERSETCVDVELVDGFEPPTC